MSAKAPVTDRNDGVSGWTDAHVVFCGRSDIAWLRVLRPGFRHCFVVLGNGQAWVSVDPLSCWTDIEIQPAPGDFDLPGWYRGQGMTTVATTLRRDAVPRPLPMAPFTCVEAVKRVLGIRDRLILTPWQLFRRLVAENAPAASDLTSATAFPDGSPTGSGPAGAGARLRDVSPS